MKRIVSIIRNNFLRALEDKNQIIVVLLMSSISIMFAVYFTSKLEVKGNIAVVTHSQSFHLDSKYIKVRIMDKEPAESELVMNKYDVVVFDKGNGKYTIRTIKSNSYKTMIENALKNPASFRPPLSGTRGIGTNILGYLVMFILLQGMMLMNLFSEDKEKGTLKRIVTSPASISRFLAAHSVFNFIMVYIPTFLVLVIAKEALKVNIGFSYIQYTFLLGLITILSTAFALFICAVVEKEDNVSTAGATIIVLTSIMSGSFFSFGNNNAIFKAAVNLLPQKSFMSLVHGMELGGSLNGYLAQIGYILIVAALFFAGGIVVCKRRFNEGRY